MYSPSRYTHINQHILTHSCKHLTYTHVIYTCTHAQTHIHVHVHTYKTNNHYHTYTVYILYTTHAYTCIHVHVYTHTTNNYTCTVYTIVPTRAQTTTPTNNNYIEY